MSLGRNKGSDHRPLTSAVKRGSSLDQPTLPSPRRAESLGDDLGLETVFERINPQSEANVPADTIQSSFEAFEPSGTQSATGTDRLRPKEIKRKEKDHELLTEERWLVRNGHTATYVGLFLFSIMVLYRPYEIVPGLGFLSATAFYFAVATMAIYLPS